MRLLHRPVGLAAHRELLVAGGWLALLIGCVGYDLGVRAGSEATRVAGMQLGREAGHPEIVGWAHEMQAWFALTQGRYPGVLRAARAGQHAAPNGSAAVQLAGQEAKALARTGDIAGVRATLDRGAALLADLPAPDRPDNHFVVDPAKWDFYAMDAYRLAGEDELAAHHAQEVLRLGISTMRMTEARLTLAACAARDGELEHAVASGIEALQLDRRSLPSLLMVAGELDAELHARYPRRARLRHGERIIQECPQKPHRSQLQREPQPVRCPTPTLDRLQIDVVQQEEPLQILKDGRPHETPVRLDLASSKKSSLITIV